MRLGSSGLARRRLGVLVGCLASFLPAISLAQAEAANPPLAPPVQGPAGYDRPPGYPPPTADPPNRPYPADLEAPLPPPAAVTTEPAAIAAAPASPPAEAPRPYSAGATLSLSLDTESGANSLLTAPLVEGAYAVHRRVFVALEFGFGWLVDNQGLGESTFRAGNPQLSGTYHDRMGPWELRGRLGVTAPLAHVPLGPDGRLYHSLYSRALAVSGMWDQWLWYPDRMAVPVQLRLNGQWLVAELTPALVFGVTHGTSGTDFVGQLALEAQLPLNDRFLVCPRFQAVLLPTSSIDVLQTAAVLRGIVVTKAGRFFASILLNLDEPLRSAGAGQRWGFHLGKEMDL